MEINKSNKIEFWREQVARAEANPAGITAYCTEQGIKMSTYYGWRKFLKDGTGGGSESKKSQEPKIIKKNSPFLPVEIVRLAARAENQSSNQSLKLNMPEARWVAEIMVHLIRGLS